MGQRNPYVILGIPFGSSREDANIAFARRARILRRAGNQDPSKLTDLTWALNQVDEGIVHPQAAMEIYRIPADPNAFTVDGVGALAPAPEVLVRQAGDPAADLAALQAAAAHEYLRYLMTLRAEQIATVAP